VSSKYNKWNTSARNVLFNTLSLTHASDYVTESYIPKFGTPIESSIMSRYLAEKHRLSDYVVTTGSFRLYYTPKLSGFVQVLDFIPTILDNHDNRRDPSLLKTIKVRDESTGLAYLAALNSNLFFWLLTISSDVRNLNHREVLGFRLDIDSISKDHLGLLESLSRTLMDDIDSNSKMMTMNYEKLGKMTIQCIYPKLSKHIIDEIDRVLASHYGFTDEELDFIINYDIKYRMGRDAADGDDE
jgi:hypothetical protein